MRKSIQSKRTKFTVSTYMKEALDYEIVLFKEKKLFITIKKYNKTSGSFTIINRQGQKIDYINDGYYVVEITPLNENYNIRFYVDNNKRLIDYYIDITLENKIINNIPCYVDLYLDIVHYPDDDSFAFCDEDELKDALDKKLISKKDYLFAYEIGNKLLKELLNHKNKYINIDVIKYINQYFK